MSSSHLQAEALKHNETIFDEVRYVIWLGPGYNSVLLRKGQNVCSLFSDSHHGVRTQKGQPLSENNQVTTLTLDCSASRNMRKSISIVGLGI